MNEHLALGKSAYPDMTDDPKYGRSGLTKLELGSLMIAQGLVAKYNLKEPSDQQIIAKLSVQLATEIIYEAQKV